MGQPAPVFGVPHVSCSLLPSTGKQMVMPGDDTSLTLTLQRDIPMEVNQRFTLREGHVNVGTGVITEILD